MKQLQVYLSLKTSEGEGKISFTHFFVYLEPSLNDFQKLLEPMLGLRNVFIENQPHLSLRMLLNVHRSLEGQGESKDEAAPAGFLYNPLFHCV